MTLPVLLLTIPTYVGLACEYASPSRLRDHRRENEREEQTSSRPRGSSTGSAGDIAGNGRERGEQGFHDFLETKAIVGYGGSA